jgi:predicted dehydrogenase
MKKYNVGIIGYSWAAGAHIEAINKTPYAQVTAICSSRNLDSETISAKHGGSIISYTDPAEMLANSGNHGGAPVIYFLFLWPY